jgi:hypothetical protein
VPVRSSEPSATISGMPDDLARHRLELAKRCRPVNASLGGPVTELLE